jgi:Universal stress protein family
VLVDRGLEQTRRVLAPFRGTDHDRAALRLAKRIADNTGAEVTILHVVSPESHADADADDLLLVVMGRHWGLEHKSFGPRAEATW